MIRLDTAPDVVSMALALKLDPRQGAVKEILRHCNEKIAGFIKKVGGVKTLDELQAAVASCLHLVFEDVRSDEDLDAITAKYIAKGELAFASLRMQLEDDTFATLMEREHVKAGELDRYVAVIDGRGAKGARRYFTRWHEIAHLLTLVKQLALPFHRSRETSDDPLERLMDNIAGQIGFYSPLFEPVLKTEITAEGKLTFDVVERVRASVCPQASFHSTLIACVNRSQQPATLLEAKMAFKRAEAAELRSRQMSMFGGEKPKAKLRAVTSTQNSAARKAGFMIHKNMSIPAGSIVASHFKNSELVDVGLVASGEEDLSIWRHSDGEAIGYGKIYIEAKRMGGSFFALIQRLHAD